MSSQIREQSRVGIADSTKLGGGGGGGSVHGLSTVLTEEYRVAHPAATLDYSLPLRPPTNPRIVNPQLPLLEAVISGGQTGSDQAGIRAARRLGLATGGYAPRGWRTLDGPAPWLGTEFGLVEHWSSDYPPRTASNVHDSDATVRIASDFLSTGERCTLKAILKYKKPYLDVAVSSGSIWCFRADGDASLNDPAWADPTTSVSGPGDAFFRAFLIKYNIKVLNVAGNSNRTAPGIGALAEEFLMWALGGAS